MAVLVEEVVEDGSEELPPLDTLLDHVSVPPEYGRYASIEDSSVIERLAMWKVRAMSTLESIQTLLQRRWETTCEESPMIM